MITLNKEVIESKRLSVGEIIVLLAIHNEIETESTFLEYCELLRRKGYTCKKGTVGYFLSPDAEKLLDEIVYKSDPIVTQTDFDKLAEELIPKLQECFPEGKKEGTNFYWRGSKPDLKNRLLSFFKKYGDSYTPEEILNATKAYVSSHNGQYQYMRLLKYFIWKTERKNGETELISALAEYIENAAQVNDMKDDWTSQVI